MPSPGTPVMMQSRTMLRSAVPPDVGTSSLPSKMMPRPRDWVIFTRSTMESSPPSKSMASLVLRSAPPAAIVMSRIVMRSLRDMSHTSVSFAMSVELLMNVASMPWPA